MFPTAITAPPLFLAVMENREDIASLLLQNGADPDAYYTYGTSPFTFAAGKYPGLLEMLLNSGKKPYNSDPIYIAAMNGRLDMVKRLYPLFEKGLNTNIIDFAVDSGRTEIARFFTSMMPALHEKADSRIAKAEANRVRFQEYEKINSSPLSAPKKTGNIADKKGSFQYILEDQSPYTAEKLKPEIMKIPVGVYVPRDYNKETPFGLMVFLSWNYPDKEYRKILDKNHILWIGFDCYK